VDWVFGDFQSLKPNPDEHRIQPIEASQLDLEHPRGALPTFWRRLVRSTIFALASGLDSSAADFGAMTARENAGKQSVASDWPNSEA
jgi:hypothetical protein